MSFQMYVLHHGELPTIAALAECFKELRFPLSMTRGSLPARVFDLHGAREDVEAVAGRDVDLRFTRIARFSCGIDRGAVVACLAAAAAKFVDGMVFDPQIGRLLTVEEAIASARAWLRDTSPRQGRSTRQADIRHYLKSLLQQRSDLVLVGRLLLVRPVRHVLRGARLDRTRDKRKHELRLRRYIMPLYAGYAGGIGCNDYDDERLLTVWQPHFLPLLTDLLATDVFDRLGKTTTMGGLADRFLGETGLPAPLAVRDAWITGLVLAGETDRAAESVEQYDRAAKSAGFAGDPIKAQFERLIKDIDATCAQCHAKEAEWVNALNLEHIWEPSPFSVELPPAERASRSDEPFFLPHPWPARPSWLWGELPTRPGEVRFAKDVRRSEAYQLLVLLAPEEAEERHRALESYVLAARLTDGLLVLIEHTTAWDRHLPDELPYRLTARDNPRVHVRLIGVKHVADAFIARENPNVDMERFDYVSSRQRTSCGRWECFLQWEQGVRIIKDMRAGEMVLSKTALMPGERDLATFPKPAFGEYAELAERIRGLLRITGYGEVT